MWCINFNKRQGEDWDLKLSFKFLMHEILFKVHVTCIFLKLVHETGSGYPFATLWSKVIPFQQSTSSKYCDALIGWCISSTTPMAQDGTVPESMPTWTWSKSKGFEAWSTETVRLSTYTCSCCDPLLCQRQGSTKDIHFEKLLISIRQTIIVKINYLPIDSCLSDILVTLTIFRGSTLHPFPVLTVPLLVLSWRNPEAKDSDICKMYSNILYKSLRRLLIPAK